VLHLLPVGGWHRARWQSVWQSVGGTVRTTYLWQRQSVGGTVRSLLPVAGWHRAQCARHYASGTVSEIATYLWQGMRADCDWYQSDEPLRNKMSWLFASRICCDYTLTAILLQVSGGNLA
jgi:hypothetical protein